MNHEEDHHDDSRDNKKEKREMRPVLMLFQKRGGESLTRSTGIKRGKDLILSSSCKGRYPQSVGPGNEELRKRERSGFGAKIPKEF